jgi:hypothetical protein
MRVFGCAKFKRLTSADLDRDLSGRERLFVERHREVCDECSESEQQSCLAMNFLRSAAFDEVEVSSNFDDRVLKKLRVQTSRESFGYWSPAIAGAFVAGLAVIAALQIITRSAELRHIRVPGAEARRVSPAKSFPELDQIIHQRAKE